MKHEPLGHTDIILPPIIFGASCLGNLYQELSYQTKLDIVAQWFKHVQPPVVVDAAGKYGAGMALEILGKTLRQLDIKPDQVLISNKLGWLRTPLKTAEPTFEPGVWHGLQHDAEQAISYKGIKKCFEQGCELLGEGFIPQWVSVHDPDEYLAAAANKHQRDKRFQDIISAYDALGELKNAAKVKAIGVGAKNWKTIRQIAKIVKLDWVMLACSLTVYSHSDELLSFIDELRNMNVAIINSAVFHAGFLTGGSYFDYRKPTPQNEPELFAWRESFMAICKQHNVDPAEACIQFGLAVPGIAAVALNTSKPARVRDNVEAISAKIPTDFWNALKSKGLINLV